jgi:hypothetical protein
MTRRETSKSKPPRFPSRPAVFAWHLAGRSEIKATKSTRAQRNGTTKTRRIENTKRSGTHGQRHPAGQVLQPAHIRGTAEPFVGNSLTVETTIGNHRPERRMNDRKLRRQKNTNQRSAPSVPPLSPWCSSWLPFRPSIRHLRSSVAQIHSVFFRPSPCRPLRPRRSYFVFFHFSRGIFPPSSRLSCFRPLVIASSRSIRKASTVPPGDSRPRLAMLISLLSPHPSLLSRPPRCLDGGDVDLPHGHHCLEGTLCLAATSRKRVG